LKIKKARIFDVKIRALYCPIVNKRILPPPSLPSKSYCEVFTGRSSDYRVILMTAPSHPGQSREKWPVITKQFVICSLSSRLQRRVRAL